MIINGIKCTTIEEVEVQITDLSEEQKQLIRNDFNGIPNTPKTIIKAVTPRQMKIALVMSGIALSSINAVIDSLSEPQKSITRITWEESLEFQRDNPLLNAMAPVLGLTQEQVDQLFALAATL